MDSTALAIGLSGIIALAHYFSEDFCFKCKKIYKEIISFTAGIAVTYLFLDLFPLFSSQATKPLFIFVLVGFVLFHLVEKYIYKSVSENKLLAELALEDSVISFIYHFVVGILLVSLVKMNTTKGILFFIPVFLFTAFSTLPLDTVSEVTMKAILASSTILGVIVAVNLNISTSVFLALLGFIIGALAFTIMRHSIPLGRDGKPFFFTIGVILYASLLFLL